MNTKVKQLYEIEKLLQANGGPIPMSRQGLYQAAKRNGIYSVRIGRRVFIPSWVVDKLLDAPSEQVSPATERQVVVVNAANIIGATATQAVTTAGREVTVVDMVNSSNDNPAGQADTTRERIVEAVGRLTPAAIVANTPV